MRYSDRVLLGIGVLLLFLAGAAPASASPQLVFPKDLSQPNVKSIRVVGLCPDDLPSVKVQVTGGDVAGSTTVPVIRGAFSFEVRLDAGLNTVAVLNPDLSTASSINLYYSRGSEPQPGFTPYVLHSRGDLTAQCDQCHIFGRRGAPSYNRLNPLSPCSTNECHPGFAKAKFLHGPVGGNSCTGCHNPHGAPRKAFVGQAGKDLCSNCHSGDDGNFAGSVVHRPVAQGDCLICHDPHQSDLKFQLRGESQAALCASCHGDDRTRHKYLHGPVGTGNCVACHNPHASNHPNLLIEEKKALCFVCHKDRQEEFARPFIHKPVAGDCGVCHDPHGSETRHQLRNTLTAQAHGQTAPCLSCHQSLNPKLAEQILKSRVPHKPVQEGNCTACHTPHASSFEYQLKAPVKEICFTCHLELGHMVNQSEYKHGPVSSSDCAACHSVHGGNFPKLLDNNFPEEFYTSYETEKYAVCFDCHNDKVALSKWSRETQFRNGNRNLHYLHVNREKGRNCKACHEVHAGDQGKHIRIEIPFGSKGWSYPISYTATSTGGTCVVGCHRPLSYDRETEIKY